MKYIVNPQKIFFDWVIQKEKNQEENLHQLSFNSLYYYPQKNHSYYDHIETASFYNSTIISYGHDEKLNLKLGFHHIFPTIRKINNDTRGSYAFQSDEMFNFYINHQKVKEKLVNVKINGFITITSKHKHYNITKKLYAASTFPGFICDINITDTSNNYNQPFHLYFPKSNLENIKIPEELTANKEKFIFETSLFNRKNKKIDEINSSNIDFKFRYVISILRPNEKIHYNHQKEYKQRKEFINQIKNKCQLKTSNKYLDFMFYLCKIRASESIFKTKAGLMHSPGGGNYYAAVWTNDQIEYAAPFFAYLNYDIANIATENTFNMYEKYMYGDLALVTSIIAEGDGYWNGAKDRGDGAMFAYGTLKYLLTRNDKNLSKKYHNQIKWCIDYTIKQKNLYGVYNSDSDELENRFESGNCNISTNSIFHEALLDYKKLYNEETYENERISLENNFDNYFFNDNVEEFKTYQYCKEEKHLRSHIFYPLTAHLFTKKDEVINSLLNSPLFINGNFLTTTQCDVYWDRVTLMAIRGLYNSSYNAYNLLINYTENRLLKDHVPYPIEAYPEGNKAHLSAESALYCRLIVEGMLNYEVENENNFSLTLHLDKSQKSIQLLNFYTNGKIINIKIKKELFSNTYKVLIQYDDKTQKFQVLNNQKFTINLN